MLDLLEQSTLFEAAAAHPAARPLAGRGTAWVIRPGPEAWLVRHYRRGGAVAGVLRDRYARVGGDRARRELQVSAAARARGVPTPEVVAAARYAAGPFYRFDVAVDFVADAQDLATALFGGQSLEAARVAATAIRALCAARLYHPDLNLKNVLVGPDGGWIIDLDRARLHDRFRGGEAARMRRRLLRSLEKWQLRLAQTIAPDARRLLEEAFS